MSTFLPREDNEGKAGVFKEVDMSDRGESLVRWVFDITVM